MLDENIKWANINETRLLFEVITFIQPKTQHQIYIVILKVCVWGLQNLIINLAILSYAETNPPLKCEQWKLEIRCTLSQRMPFLIHCASFDD